MLEQQFDEYKAEYSNFRTRQERKNELIALMQENLKERCGLDICTIACLDEHEYSIESENVEDLYVIDGFLRSEEGRIQLSAIGDIERQQAQDRNKYDPYNPYHNN